MTRGQNRRFPQPLTIALTLAAVLLCGALPASAAATQRSLSPSATAQIVGGSTAAQGTWGFMAFILHVDANGDPDFLCSGTVISPNIVLTAGHCTVDETTGLANAPGGYAVVTGSVDWTSGSRQVSAVSQVIVSPHYDRSTGAGDAGLLVLSTPTVAPSLALATTANLNLLTPGTPADIAGWGQAYFGSPLQAQLRWAPTVLQSSDYCAAHGARLGTSLELCAVDQPSFTTGACFGDSGGPLLAQDADDQPVEIGVTALVPADCSTGERDIFTRVDQLSSWAASWVTTIAQKPPTVVPKRKAPTIPPLAPTIPAMTVSTARTYTREALARALGRKFTRGHQYSASCTRISASRFTCAVSWTNQPNDYSGEVSVYYLANRGGLSWAARYTLTSVNHQCYFHTRHPQQCSVHTIRGT